MSVCLETPWRDLRQGEMMSWPGTTVGEEAQKVETISQNLESKFLVHLFLFSGRQTFGLVVEAGWFCFSLWMLLFPVNSLAVRGEAFLFFSRIDYAE